MTDIFLNMDAETDDDIEQYFSIRSIQFSPHGYKYTSKTKTDGCTLVKYKKNNKSYWSVYVPLSLRGKGLAEKILSNKCVVTTPDCSIEDFLKYKNIRYKLEAKYTGFDEYHMIRDFYGNKKAKRSGVFLMNHIIEGVSILQQLNASDNAIKAFCVHPLFQNSIDLVKSLRIGYHKDLSNDVLVLAMEYRHAANSYLCRPETDHYDITNMPELINDDIKHMLIADKVQNRKDFIKYHLQHERASQLLSYFNLWLEYLGIDNNTYEQIVEQIDETK